MLTSDFARDCLVLADSRQLFDKYAVLLRTSTLRVCRTFHRSYAFDNGTRWKISYEQGVAVKAVLASVAIEGA